MRVDFSGGGPCLVSGMRSLAPDMTSEVVLSASKSDDGESGHLALQGIE